MEQAANSKGTANLYQREFWLALVGSLLPVLGTVVLLGAYSLIVSGESTSSDLTGGGVVSLALGAMAMLAVVVSIPGIIGALLVKSRQTAAAVLMFISAGLGLLLVGPLYVVSFILLLLAGILTLTKSKQSAAS